MFTITNAAQNARFQNLKSYQNLIKKSISEKKFNIFPQEEPEKEVTLFCNCFIQIGPVRKVKQCEWDYTFDESCPPVKAFNQVCSTINVIHDNYIN